jgi:transcriptional regulator with XRE-family HTH domain
VSTNDSSLNAVTLGSYLRRRRKDKKLSQLAVIRLLGERGIQIRSQSSISRYENDDRPPPPQVLVALSEILSCDPEELDKLVEPTLEHSSIGYYQMSETLARTIGRIEGPTINLITFLAEVERLAGIPLREETYLILAEDYQTTHHSEN